MKTRTLTIIGTGLILLATSFVYARIPQEHPGSYCEFPNGMRKQITKWLAKAYDDAVESILNGRNGKKIKQCKIDKIKTILPNLMFEYTCQYAGSGNDNCAQGGPKHDITKTPFILIKDPFDLFMNDQKNMDIPGNNLCGCIEGLIVHEIIHASGDVGREEGAVDCSKMLYPCAGDPTGVETPDHHNCDCTECD